MKSYFRSILVLYLVMALSVACTPEQVITNAAPTCRLISPYLP